MMTRKNKMAKSARLYGLGVAVMAAVLMAGATGLKPGGFELAAGPVYITSGPDGLNAEIRTKSDFRLTLNLAENRRIHLK